MDNSIENLEKDLYRLVYAARRCVLVPSTHEYNIKELKKIVDELDIKYPPFPKEPKNKWR